MAILYLWMSANGKSHVLSNSTMNFGIDNKGGSYNEGTVQIYAALFELLISNYIYLNIPWEHAISC